MNHIYDYIKNVGIIAFKNWKRIEIGVSSNNFSTDFVYKAVVKSKRSRFS